MKKGFIWVVLALAVLVFASGCTSSGEEERQSSYTERITTNNGQAIVDTNMPIKVLSLDDPLTTRQMDKETWYAIDMDSILSDTYAFTTSIRDVEDMERVNISTEMPSGGTAYVRNLDVNEVNGKWQLTGEVAGIERIAVWDGDKDPVVFFWEGESITLPDLVDDKFVFMIYMDTTYVDPAPVVEQTPVVADPVPAASAAPAPAAVEPTPAAQNTKQTKQVDSSNGQITIDTNYAVETIIRSDPRTLYQLDFSTWYCLDTDAELPDSYAASARFSDPKQLEGVDIKFKLPNGEVAQVRNLKVEEVNGKWQMEGDYDGVFGIGIWDGLLADEPDVFVSLEQPIVLPGYVGTQDFSFMIYANTAYNG